MLKKINYTRITQDSVSKEKKKNNACTLLFSLLKMNMSNNVPDKTHFYSLTVNLTYSRAEVITCTLFLIHAAYIFSYVQLLADSLLRGNGKATADIL